MASACLLITKTLLHDGVSKELNSRITYRAGGPVRWLKLPRFSAIGDVS